jgi:hypothetical protein
MKNLTSLILGINPTSRLTTVIGMMAVIAQILEQYKHGEISEYGLITAVCATAFVRLTDEGWVKAFGDRIGARTRE